VGACHACQAVWTVEPSKTNCAAILSSSNTTDAFHSFDEEGSVEPLEQFPTCSTFGNTLNPTDLSSASINPPDSLNQQPQMQAHVQPCDAVQMHRGSLCSTSLTIARGGSIAGAPRSSVTPSSARGCGRPPFVRTSTPASTNIDSAVSATLIESEITRRARYAANQRHNRARNAKKDSQQNEDIGVAEDCAAKRKQRHREKNKVAAAKCRSRQRKQVQTIEEKSSRLCEENIELKTMIQELRVELNRLRSVALDHQQCKCSVARYNSDQAERVVAEYRLSYWAQAQTRVCGELGLLPLGQQVSQAL